MSDTEQRRTVQLERYDRVILAGTLLGTVAVGAASTLILF